MTEKKEIILPNKLVNAINDLGLGKTNTGHAFTLMANIIRRGGRGYIKENYVSLPKNYLTKVFSTGFYKWFTPLKENGILEMELNTKGTPRYYTNRAINYRINPDLINGEFDVVNAKVSKYESNNRKEDIILNNTYVSKDYLKRDFESLILNKEHLKAAITRSINNIKKSDYELNENIKDPTFWVYNCYTGGGYFTSKEKVFKSLKYYEGASLIKDGDSVFIDSIESFIKTKKSNCEFNYNLQLEKLLRGDYYLNRNNTNNRLDHNLTSLPSSMLSVIKEDNDLIEIDLANSQFTLLSMIMDNEMINKTDDFYEFKSNCSKGLLYNYLMEKLSLNRNEVKKIMMNIAFSSYRNKSKAKKLFNECFPSVLSYIENYKKELDEIECLDRRGYKNFAVNLQRVESEIFIDNFYYYFKQTNVWCITKHDSLIIKNQDIKKVLHYLEEECNKINLECTFKVHYNRNDKTSFEINNF